MPAACGAVLTDSTLTGEAQVSHSRGVESEVHSCVVSPEGRTNSQPSRSHLHTQKLLYLMGLLETDVPGEIRIF